MATYTYSAYGLTIESDFSLPGLSPATSSDRVQVSIRHPRTIDWPGVARRQDGGDFLALQLADVLRYSVVDGREITFAPFDHTPQQMADFYMAHTATGLGFALLLRQRGYLTLHAAVVARDDEAVGFIADSGWGKSTLAEFFFQNGYGVLCDDIAVLKVSSEGIDAIPGNPTIKLRSGSEGVLDQAAREHQPDLDGRRHLRREPVQAKAVPLKKLYLLQKQFAPELAIEPLAPSAQVVELVRHTHGAHLFTRPDYQARLLSQCNGVVNSVGLSLLRRPEGLDKLPLIMQAVEEDLARLAPAGA